MMLKTFSDSALRGFMLRPAAKNFSVTLAIRDKFEAAWQDRQKTTKAKEVHPHNKEKYGNGFYGTNIHRLKKGYEHPYHTKENSLIVNSSMNILRLLKEVAGPE
jgi:hypothetical protein